MMLTPDDLHRLADVAVHGCLAANAVATVVAWMWLQAWADAA